MILNATKASPRMTMILTKRMIASSSLFSSSMMKRREMERIVKMVSTSQTTSLSINNNNPNFQQKRLKSSAFASIPIPESVREAVKSSVLDEATRTDSKLWGKGDLRQQQQQSQTPQQNPQHPHHINGKVNPQTELDVDANAFNQEKDEVKSSFYHGVGSVGGGINDPISALRLKLLHDPLDEWHLDATPQTYTNNDNNSTFILPEGVEPLSTQTDPFILAQHDMETLSEGIRTDLIGTDHPVLATAASYFFDVGREGGKKVRPMMVLLLSRAMAVSASSSSTSENENEKNHDVVLQPKTWQRADLPSAQRRLAEITEMLHTASLFHDDVIDGSNTRRGQPSANATFGNKTAILAGDYLLARACIFLARLRNVEVVETISTVIEHLVRGEVMQMRGSGGSSDNGGENQEAEEPNSSDHMIYYLCKNFYKTGSLMANSCKSAAVLGDYNDDIVHAAYRYGKHLGVAFQLVDDALDYEGNALSLGKPALADLNAGLSTAPILFALQEKEKASSSSTTSSFQEEEEKEEILNMMKRKYRQEGDIERAVKFVNETDGIRKTKDLALVHVEIAVEAVMDHLEPSVYRDALVHLAYKVVDRSR